MTRTVLLNIEDHKNVRIDNRHNRQLGAKYGDMVNACLTFVGEFRTMQAHYPLFFQKNATTGQFHPVALMGFAQDENLFLTDTGWGCSYVPALMARQPFSIGIRKEPNSDQEHRVVHIDLDHPRVNNDEGEALFLEFGGSSEYLQKMADLLETIHQGMQQNEQFVQALVEMELLESFTLDIELCDGSSNQLIGYYTINEDRLFGLDSSQLHKLHEQGFLTDIYMMLASQSQLGNLIERKNATLTAV